MAISKYIGSSGTAGGFGTAAFERAKASGMSSSDILKQVKAAGLTMGGNLAAKLDNKVQYNNPVQKAVATYGDWNTGGKAFGGKDIKALQQQGMNPNQIMKIAAALGNLEGGKISNRANTLLTAGFAGANKGRGLSDTYFANTNDPFMQSLGRDQGSRLKKELTWGGISATGKPMALMGKDFTKDPFGSGKDYTWTPGKGLTTEGLMRKKGTKTEAVTEPVTATEPTATTESAPAGPITKEETTIPGVGFDVFSLATGWKSKKSSRSRSGAQAQGLASQRVAPTGGWQYNIG